MKSLIAKESVVHELLDEASKLLAIEELLAGIRENDFEFAGGTLGLSLILKSGRESIEKIHSKHYEPELN